MSRTGRYRFLHQAELFKIDFLLSKKKYAVWSWSSVQLLLRLMGENGLVYHFQDLHSILMPVLAAMAGVLFLEGGLGAGSCSTWVWDVPKISLFPKILSLKSSGTWYGNPYTKSLIIDIKFCFTCGGLKCSSVS